MEVKNSLSNANNDLIQRPKTTKADDTTASSGKTAQPSPNAGAEVKLSAESIHLASSYNQAPENQASAITNPEQAKAAVSQLIADFGNHASSAIAAYSNLTADKVQMLLS